MNLHNELSSLSYTNKDFNSIYVELLEYAKKLSYRWDPTESDESDPGVVLLKLAALIGDKNNYNIDTSVLELMPASVTQLAAARQLFEQCGYYMPYYQAADGKITLAAEDTQLPPEVKSYVDEGVLWASDIVYNIPPFTMVTDIDSSIVYTITPDNELTLGSSIQSYRVLEGIAVTYTINNDPLITLANLDSSNRIYFTDYNIAENGIFITNQGNANYTEWERVDNLEVSKKGSRCYKFGITTDTSICYVEFPEDIEYIIGEGLNITYIKTSGKDGNIGPTTLNSFYVDTKFHCANINQAITVTSKNIVINNPLPILNGSDPEDIDSAYKSYKRVKDTFNTLVSLKDYTDYMIQNQFASNGYVCDRTNDIQHSYKILKEGSNTDVLKTVVSPSLKEIEYIDYLTGKETTVQGMVPSMEPYDLCVYALAYKPVVDTEDVFRETFKLVDAKEYQQLVNTFEEVKSIQHNFKTFETNKILIIKNKYPIVATVIPKYKLDTVQQYEVYDNIRRALYNAINSKEVSLGEQVSYDLLYDVVSSADERIKAASIEYPRYETYAVYKDDTGEFRELRIDAESSEPTTAAERLLWKRFRAEIFAKNVLKGVTPLYDFDSKFTYSLNQSETHLIEHVESITTDVVIPMTEASDNVYETNQPLRDNENVLFYRDNLIPEPTYPKFSSYVKILYSLEGRGLKSIPADSKYQLTGDDYIVFFWKSLNANRYYDYIKYDSSSASLANYISPSFDMTCSQGGIDYTTYDQLRSTLKNLPAGVHGITSGSMAASNDVTLDKFVANVLLSESANSVQVLTGNNQVSLYNPNRIHINNPTNGTKDVYWITNTKEVYKNPRSVLNNKEVCRIPWIQDETNENGYSYTLQSGEYFMYTNSSHTVLHILGEGTTLYKNINPKNDGTWVVEYLPYETLLLKGLAAIEDSHWYNVAKSNADVLIATENEQILLGSGTSFKIYDLENSSTIALDSAFDLQGCSISYQEQDSSIQSPDMIYSNDIKWRVQPILNLNISAEKPQQIQDNQTITLKTATGNEIIEGSDDKVTCLVSNYDLVFRGGSNIPVKVYSLTEGAYVPVDILKYTSTQDIPQKVTYNNDTGYTRVDIAVEDTDGVTLPSFRLLAGKYMLKAILDRDITGLDIIAKIGSAEYKLAPIYNSSNCYMIECSEDSDIELKMYSVDPVSVSIYPLKKYTTKTIDELSISSEEIIEKLSELDKYSDYNVFNIPSDSIKNPLISTSFHNPIHFYNKFTIDEWKQVNERDINIITGLR